MIYFIITVRHMPRLPTTKHNTSESTGGLLLIWVILRIKRSLYLMCNYTWGNVDTPTGNPRREVTNMIADRNLLNPSKRLDSATGKGAPVNMMSNLKIIWSISPICAMVMIYLRIIEYIFSRFTFVKAPLNTRNAWWVIITASKTFFQQFRTRCATNMNKCHRSTRFRILTIDYCCEESGYEYQRQPDALL